MKGRERWGIRERMSPVWMAKTEREKKKKEKKETLVYSVSHRMSSCEGKPMKTFYFDK